MPKIKICGITKVEEVEMLNQHQVDYGGFVLFYPKSKRNVEIECAKKLIDVLNDNIRKVAVTVSPTLEQVQEIEKVGFDILQIHGELRKEILDQTHIPIFRAFNMKGKESGKGLENHERIAGVVFDGKIPGKGEVFDWSLIEDFQRGERLFMLAGGLCADNVQEGIQLLSPDIVDVSSGVEKESGQGKDPDRIAAFVKAVRE